MSILPLSLAILSFLLAAIPQRVRGVTIIDAAAHYQDADKAIMYGSLRRTTYTQDQAFYGCNSYAAAMRPTNGKCSVESYIPNATSLELITYPDRACVLTSRSITHLEVY